MGPLWGVVLWFSWWGSCACTNSPIQKSTTESTSMVSPSMPKIICVQQTYDGLSRASSHYTVPKNCVQAGHDVQANSQAKFTHQRYWKGCHFAILQKFGTSIGVGSLFSLILTLVEHVHHHQLRAHHPQSLGWLTQPVLGQSVCAALMVS